MKKIKKKKKFLILVLLLTVANLSFSAKVNYDPLNFIVSAQYVMPVKIQFDQDIMNLGNYLTIDDFTGLNKSFGITVNSEPSDTLDLTIAPTITLENSAKGKSLTIKQSLSETTVTIPESGAASTLITFTSDDSFSTDGDGTYTGQTTITATLN